MLLHKGVNQKLKFLISQNVFLRTSYNHENTLEWPLLWYKKGVKKEKRNHHLLSVYSGLVTLPDLNLLLFSSKKIFGG